MVLNIGICHLIKLFKHGKLYSSQKNSKNRKCTFRIKVESDPSPKKLDEKVQAASHWPKLWICKTSKTLSEFPTPSYFPGTLLEMTCDGDILFSERSPTKAPTPVPTQSFSPTAFDPQDGLSSFHQNAPGTLKDDTFFWWTFNSIRIRDLPTWYSWPWLVTMSIRRIYGTKIAKSLHGPS